MINTSSIIVGSGIVRDSDFRTKVYAGNQDKVSPAKIGDEEDYFEISEEAKARQLNELSEQEQKEVDELKKRDREVRSHEQAHMAAGGSLVSGPYYEYTTGPDSQRYATAGSVSIDTSPVNGDPEATIRKMQQVRTATLAPVNPSPQDRRVASEATRTEARARAELRETETESASNVVIDSSFQPSNDTESDEINASETPANPSATNFVLTQREMISQFSVEVRSTSIKREVLAYSEPSFKIAV